MLTDFVDHRDEFIRIYSSISSSGLLTEIHGRISDLVNVNSGSASEKISKIKSKFVSAIGKELAKHYIIEGLQGEGKRIMPDRKLVMIIE